MVPLDLIAFALAGPVGFLAVLAGVAVLVWLGWAVLLRQRESRGLHDDRDAEYFAGQSVAYDAESGEYICSDVSWSSLRATMRQEHPGRIYRITEYPAHSAGDIHVHFEVGDCVPDQCEKGGAK